MSSELQPMDEIRGHVREAYRLLVDAMRPDGEGIDGVISVFATLYGYEARQAEIKLREAMMWLTEGVLSVG